MRAPQGKRSTENRPILWRSVCGQAWAGSDMCSLVVEQDESSTGRRVSFAVRERNCRSEAVVRHEPGGKAPRSQTEHGALETQKRAARVRATRLRRVVNERLGIGNRASAIGSRRPTNQSRDSGDTGE